MRDIKIGLPTITWEPTLNSRLMATFAYIRSVIERLRRTAVQQRGHRAEQSESEGANPRPRLEQTLAGLPIMVLQCGDNRFENGCCRRIGILNCCCVLSLILRGPAGCFPAPRCSQPPSTLLALGRGIWTLCCRKALSVESGIVYAEMLKCSNVLSHTQMPADLSGECLPLREKFRRREVAPCLCIHPPTESRPTSPCRPPRVPAR